MLTSTGIPEGEYFRALDRRFARTCSTRNGSACTMTGPGPGSRAIRRWGSCAWYSATWFATTCSRFVGRQSTMDLPDSIRETSRRSVMRRSRRSAWFSMIR